MRFSKFLLYVISIVALTVVTVVFVSSAFGNVDNLGISGKLKSFFNSAKSGEFNLASDSSAIFDRELPQVKEEVVFEEKDTKLEKELAELAKLEESLLATMESEKKVVQEELVAEPAVHAEKEYVAYEEPAPVVAMIEEVRLDSLAAAEESSLGKENKELKLAQEKLIAELLKYKRRAKILNGEIVRLKDLNKEAEVQGENLGKEANAERDRLESSIVSKDREIESINSELQRYKSMLVQSERKEEDLHAANVELERYKSMLASAEGENKRLQDKNAELAKYKDILAEYKSKNQELVAASAEMDRYKAQLVEFEESLEKQKISYREVASKLNDAITKAQGLKSSYLEVKSENEKVAAQLADIRRTNVNLQNELMLKETEISLLNGGERTSVPVRISDIKEIEKVDPSRKVAKVTVIEVLAQKVNIRSGASKRHSPIMQVGQGTRLTVESRNGEWYRVFTPTGGRGYINASVTRVVEELDSSGKKPIMVNNKQSGFVPFGQDTSRARLSIEEKAFHHLKAGIK